tara:strand:+ start:191 stop:367 length:177 start_codon:yes stop_codon:yes gene_type:complete
MINKRNFLKITIFSFSSIILLFSSTFIPNLVLKNKNYIKKKFLKKKFFKIWILKKNDS